MCWVNTHPIDGRPQNEVQVGPDKLEVIASFCYQGDMLSAGGGCEIAVTTRGRSSGIYYYELSHPATSFTRPVAIYTALSGGAPTCSMPVNGETWPLTKTNLLGNDRAMIRQIFSTKPEDVATVRSSELLQSLRTSTSFCGREGFPGLGMLSVLVVQSEQHVIFRLMAEGGKRRRRTAVSGSLRQLTLKKGAPGDTV